MNTLAVREYPSVQSPTVTTSILQIGFNVLAQLRACHWFENSSFFIYDFLVSRLVPGRCSTASVCRRSIRRYLFTSWLAASSLAGEVLYRTCVQNTRAANHSPVHW